MAKDVIYFDEMVAGTKTESMGRTITETDVIQFCMLSGDNRPIRCDVEYCKQYSPSGERIVDPLMIQCLYFSLLDNTEFNAQIAKSVLAFLGVTDWKNIKDARIGDTIHSTMEIISLRDNKPDRGIMTQKISILNQHGEVIQEGIHAAYIGKKCFFEKS